MSNNTGNVDFGITAHDHATKPIKNIQSTIIRFVGAISASLAAVKVAVFPITQATEFDRVMRDVQKTTNLTDAEIKGLSGTLLDLSKNISVTQVELATIAAIAGQLGLKGAASIAKFTESVARAKVTLGIGEEQVAEFAAQLLNIHNIPVDNIENLFSTINELSNNSVANAQVLFDVMKRIGNVAGVNVKQAAALAAYAADLGINPEVAGTSYAKFFANMLSESKKFASLMRITQTEWINLVNDDAVEAFKAAAKELNSMGSAAQAVQTKELFGGGRLFAFMSKVINDAGTGFERLNRHVASANSSFAAGTSSIEEYEKIMRSVKEQATLLKNDVAAAATEVGTELLPELLRILKELQTFFTSTEGRDSFLELGKQLKGIILGIESFVHWVADLNISWANFLHGIGLFLAFGLASVVVKITATLFHQIKALYTLGNTWKVAAANAKEYIATALAAGAIKVGGPVGTGDTGAGAAVGGGAAASASYALSKAKSEEQALQALRTQVNVQKGQAGMYAAQRAALDEVRDAEIAAFNARSIGLRRDSAAAVLIRKERGLATEAAAKQRKALTALQAENALAHKVALNNVYRYERGITGVAKSYTAASTTSAVFGKALGSVVGKIKPLIGWVATLGRTILGAFGGPIGFAITALLLFGSEIAEFLGFAGKAAEEEVDARILDRKMREAAEAAINSYVAYAKEFAAKKKDSIDLSGLLSSGNAINVSSANTTAVTELMGSVEALRDSKVYTAQIVQDMDAWVKAAADAGLEIAQIDSQLVELKRKADTALYLDKKGEGGAYKQIQGDIAALTLRRQELTFAAENASDAESTLNDTYDRTITTVINLQKHQDRMAASLQKGATKQFYDAATALLDYQNSMTEVAVKTAELQAAEEALQASREAGDNKGKGSKEALDTTMRLGREIRVTTARSGELLDAYTAAASSISSVNQEMLNALGKGSASATAAVLGVLNAKGGRAAIQDVKELNGGLRDSALEASRLRDETNKYLTVFKSGTKGLRDAVASLNAVYANMSSTLNASKDRYADLTRSVRELTRARNADAASTKRNAESEKQLSADLASLAERRDREIAHYQSMGRSPEFIASLERQWAARAKEAEEVSRLAGNARDLNDEKAREQVAVEKLKNSQKAYAEVLKLIAENSKKGEDGLSFYDRMTNGAEMAQNDLATLNSIGDAANESEKEVAMLLTKLASFSDLVPKYLGDAVGALPSSGMAAGYLKEVGSITTAWQDTRQDSVEVVKEMTASITQSLDTMEKGFELTSKKHGDVVSAFTANNEAAKAVMADFSRDTVVELDKVNVSFDQVIQSMQAISTARPKVTIDTSSLDPAIAQKYRDNLEAALGEVTVPLGAATTAALDEITNKFKTALVDIPMTADTTSLRTSAEKAATHLAATFDPGAAHNSMQKAIDSGSDYTMNVKANVTGTTGNLDTKRDYADGGYVTGPGSGTSDSINAKLSNGEYVMDARTTRLFGSSFFKDLQNQARNKSIRVPGFATGGPVGIPQSASTSITNIVNQLSGKGDSGVTDTMALSLSIGGTTYTTKGEREQVTGLAQALKNLGRGR